MRLLQQCEFNTVHANRYNYNCLLLLSLDELDTHGPCIILRQGIDIFGTNLVVINSTDGISNSN